MNARTTSLIFLAYLPLVIFIGWVTFLQASPAGADSNDTLITILTPQNGEIVKPTFDIRYKLGTGVSEDSVDLFLDGLYQPGMKQTFTDVPIGKHEIGAKVSTKGPEPIIGWDHIEIEVKKPE